MSSSLEPARRSLATAARALDEFRRLSGAPEAEPPSGWRAPAEAGARAALDEARGRLEELGAELERVRRGAAAEAEAASAARAAAVRALEEAAPLRARAAELEAELAASRAALEASAARALRAEEDSRRAAEGLAAFREGPGEDAQRRTSEAASRVSLLEAECVRLEKLRHAADQSAADAEARGRDVAEALRREIRSAHAALDHAAVEAGAGEAKTRGEAETLRARLESATTRLYALEREKRLEQARGVGDSAALQTELLRAQAVAASLRQELGSVRGEAERREAALRADLSSGLSALEEARRALADRPASPVPPAVVATAEPLEPEPPPAEAGASEEASAAEPDFGPAEPFVQPPVEPLLDPGWARLVRLVRPSVDSAYAHLRRLSATALSSGQKTLLRLAAASVAQASDSLSSIELALEEGPAPAAAASVLPSLEASLAAWETAFRGRGVALAREFSAPLPETAHDPKELRIALHHVLRNALEAVPRGGRVSLRAWRGPDGGLRLEFDDDGPGFPPEWLARRFEPFAAPRRGRAGLGLSLVRRTLRRWGGDAEASNASSGRGARLTLIFAPPPPPSI